MLLGLSGMGIGKNGKSDMSMRIAPVSSNDMSVMGFNMRGFSFKQKRGPKKTDNSQRMKVMEESETQSNLSKPEVDEFLDFSGLGSSNINDSIEKPNEGKREVWKEERSRSTDSQKNEL